MSTTDSAPYMESHCREEGGVTFCDFRGHRYTAPWRCLCCGDEIELYQWRFGRSCPMCDTGSCYDGKLGSYMTGHHREDIVSSTPVSNLAVWCGCRTCYEHAPLNPFAVSSPAKTENTAEHVECPDTIADVEGRADERESG